MGEVKPFFLRWAGWLREWALPLGMLSGAVGYVLFHFVPVLAPLKPVADVVSADVVPVFLFLMLFFTFCKVQPRALRVRRWHVWLLAFQVAGSMGVALVLHGFDVPCRLLAEGFLVCLVCPTAAAAAVVTGKLGGSETSLTAYTILSNGMAALLIPLSFPLVEAHVELPFLVQCGVILRKVFPLLILPLLSAWALRWLWPSAHRAVVRRFGDAAFYLWAFNLVVVIAQALRSVVNGPEAWATKLHLALVGLVACVVFFVVGKTVGTRYGERISAGQALGQKNTVFAIWVAYMYLSPIVTLAPASYILWQNIFNSWQIERKLRRDRRRAVSASRGA